MEKYNSHLIGWFNLILIFISTVCYGQTKMNYQVSFNEPEKHYLEVELTCNELSNSQTTFILPVWTPGYYKILDSPKYIVDFTVKNSNGDKIDWHKKSKNHWVVHNGSNKNIMVTYRVFANRKSVAESNVNKEKAFIMPNNIFMHIENNINNPVTVIFTPYKNWNTISTGLKRIKNVPKTFYAKNFDILYDSPVYIGNQHVVDFQHEGKTYNLSIARPKGLNENKFVEDLKKIISTTTSIMKDVPYEKYTFIMMEAGGGGLEHWNSQAVFTKGSFDFKSDKQYIDFLNFISHEYFHLYNVKAIRPINLGPFDYNKENYTDMLWVSEGLTVYYEYIIMMRAGLLNGQRAFEYFGESIKKYENKEGKNHMSLSRSSFDIWLNFLNRDENSDETTISYYNKGPVIGLLLDLEIRNSTKNEKSLDDVMRFLYNQYYLIENRGFKKEEFWSICEKLAGKSLSEIREYVDTVKDIDYQKYLNYAGLQIDLSPIDSNQDKGKVIKRLYTLSEKPAENKLQLEIRKSIFRF